MNLMKFWFDCKLLVQVRRRNRCSLMSFQKCSLYFATTLVLNETVLFLFEKFLFFCSNGTYFFWRRFSSISFHNGTTLNPSFDLFLSRHFQYFFSVFFLFGGDIGSTGSFRWFAILIRHERPRNENERAGQDEQRERERERENERMREKRIRKEREREKERCGWKEGGEGDGACFEMEKDDTN